jgi:hypothetical protein
MIRPGRYFCRQDITGSLSKPWEKVVGPLPILMYVSLSANEKIISMHLLCSGRAQQRGENRTINAGVRATKLTPEPIAEQK